MNKKLLTSRVLLFFLGLIPGLALAQSQEHLQILQDYEEGRISAEAAVISQLTPEDGVTIKCGTPALTIYHDHIEEMSAALRNKVEMELINSQSGSQMQESYISPSGRFEITYDRTGADAVPGEDANQNGIPDYVEWAAEAADSSYRHEVLRLGFTNPIPEGARYTIIIRDQGAGIYGRAYRISNSQVASVFEVDNDFPTGQYPPNSDPMGDVRGALKVTVAHEFKHAIQFENGWNGPSSRTWEEMDATLMEEVVYDDVNDYYNYIKRGFESDEPTFSSIFGNPSAGVPNGSGLYSNMTWLLYFAESLDISLLKDAWDILETDRLGYFEDALLQSFSQNGENFEVEFVRNHLWHYSARDRSPNSPYGFEEKGFYPNAALDQQFLFVPAEAANIQDLNPLAARYFEVYPDPADQGAIDLAVNFDSTQIGIGLLVFKNNGEVSEVIRTGAGKQQQYLALEEEWQDVEKLGLVLSNYSNVQSSGSLQLLFGKDGSRFKITDPEVDGRPETFTLYQNYPNPFNPTTTIQFDLQESGDVRLEVFTVTGQKVRTLVNESLQFGTYRIPFQADNLASGIYIYRLQSPNGVQAKKMTIIK